MSTLIHDVESLNNTTNPMLSEHEHQHLLDVLVFDGTTRLLPTLLSGILLPLVLLINQRIDPWPLLRALLENFNFKHQPHILTPKKLFGNSGGGVYGTLSKLKSFQKKLNQRIYYLVLLKNNTDESFSY